MTAAPAPAVPERTQVGIVGAGPAGLVLGALLAAAGVDAVVIESRAREYVEARIRAGVLEAGTVDLLDRLGVAGRLHAEGLVHAGVILQFDGVRHRIDLAKLTGGRSITVYGQQEVVKDLIAHRLDAGLPLAFEATVTGVDGIDSAAGGAGGRRGSGGHHGPVIHWVDSGGRAHTLDCDVVAGCDGFHGVSRGLISDGLRPGALRTFEREYPYGWLGILAAVEPSTDELIYAYHERGFAMHSLRSPEISRLYLQVEPTDDVANWPDTRIWDELQIRLGAPGWTLTEGPIIDKGITPMRSFAAEPMRHGALYLAGDAAHIVPPTGAKGLNLAVADVTVLAEALVGWYRSGSSTGLDGYSDRCLRRVWRVQDFATMMTTLLHVDPTGDPFELGVQRARQAYVGSSEAMQTVIAENYVGLPLD